MGHSSSQIPFHPRANRSQQGLGRRGQRGTFGPKAEVWLLETHGILQPLINLQKSPSHRAAPQGSTHGMCLEPFPGHCSSSDTWLCSHLQPGPAIPSWGSGQETGTASPWAGTRPQARLNSSRRGRRDQKRAVTYNRLVGRPCRDTEPGTARQRQRRILGSLLPHPFIHPFIIPPSLHPSIH